MKFPINILEGVRNAGKSTFSEKLTFVIFLIIIGDFIVYSQFLTVVESYGIPKFLFILIIAGINISIFINIFRFYIVKEDDKISEDNHSRDTSLSNYNYIRDKKEQEVIKVAPIFEYTDGNFFFLLKITYGETDSRKAEGTRKFFEEMTRETLSIGAEIKLYNMPENFEDSIECDNYLSFIGNKTDNDNQELVRTTLDIFDHTLALCSQHRELCSTIVCVKTRVPIQLYMFESLITEIISINSKRSNSIRSLDFADKSSMRNILRDYYCLEALDLASLKSVELSKEIIIKYRNKVKVNSIKYKDGEEELKQKYKFLNNGKRL